MSIYSKRQAHRRNFPGNRGDGRIVDDEPERDEDGSLNLTNKYLRELFKKNGNNIIVPRNLMRSYFFILNDSATWRI